MKVRAFYDDFETFTEDQELLVAMPDAVDYVEGFILLNEQSLHSSSVAFPSHLEFTPEFDSNGSNYRVYHCIEFAIHDYQVESTDVEQVSRSHPLPPPPLSSKPCDGEGLMCFFPFRSRPRFRGR